MSSLPKDWTIKGYEHALRIIKSLIEQGNEKRRLLVGTGEWPFWLLVTLESAKAVLDEWESYGARDDDKTHEFTQGIEFELRNFTIRQARAFAPRMKEAGMTVPE